MFALLKKQFIALGIIIVAALLSPAVVGRTMIRKNAFDPKPLELLKTGKPQFVVIGDSMCRSRVEEGELEKLTGRQVVDLAQNGSSSARWYLILKNYLAASGAKPRMTFIFFRDTVLTEPTHRTGGKYRRELEEAMTDREPVVDALLSSSGTGRSPWQTFLSRVYPVQDRQTAAREATEERLLQIASISLTRDGLRQRLNETFDLTRLRQNVPSDLASEEVAEVKSFDPSPAKSFLPHMIALAKEHEFPLCFVRVKRSKFREERWLNQYLADLQTYLAAQGVNYYDETSDPEITPEMFSDGDHIARKYRPFVTARLHSRLSALFQ